MLRHGKAHPRRGRNSLQLRILRPYFATDRVFSVNLHRGGYESVWTVDFRRRFLFFFFSHHSQCKTPRKPHQRRGSRPLRMRQPRLAPCIHLVKIANADSEQAPASHRMGFTCRAQTCCIYSRMSYSPRMRPRNQSSKRPSTSFVDLASQRSKLVV